MSFAVCPLQDKHLRFTGPNQVSDPSCREIRRLRSESSVLSESPPPSPSIFFGRDDLIESIVGFAESLRPIALIGTGGIGKTSTALTVLHDDRIKERFGDDRRFIRCDKIPASLPHFLHQLSKTIGAGIKNPEDIAPLRPFLSSKDMFIVLDNAESILDPHATNAEEIYEAVEELSQLGNVCVCITSRISTFPPNFEWLDIPTLSKEAACDTFYRIYKHDQRSDRIDSILERLDFHALSITLLATAAHHSRWDTSRLVEEWDARRTGMLQTGRNKSLAAAVELSLSSPTFQELGPDARDLLRVIAFFPQGVDENKIDWLFPTIPRRKDIFDKFSVLSLTYRDGGFVTMLAPVRDYLSPQNPMSIPLLCSTRDRYFARLMVRVEEPGRPGFEEARWIESEDVNVEHLLDVFATIDAASRGVWDACAHFMEHVLWHKPRLVTLGPKIEALADDHPSKLECLYQLSRLFQMIRNHMERKRLLTLVVELSRERGDDQRLAEALIHLSTVHSNMGLHEKGIRLAEESSEISERLGDAVEQARALTQLGRVFYCKNQLDRAEEVASQALDLLSGRNKQFRLCQCHRLLGQIYRAKNETETSIRHSETALGIASSLNGLNLLFWIHFDLAELFFEQARFDDANAHIQHAKLHAVNNHDSYILACATELQARVWHRQCRIEEAKSEGLRAVGLFEKLGVAKDANRAREFLLRIDRDT